MLPGALSTSTAATSGVGGLLRIVRAGVSARWTSEKCSEWGEDAVSLAAGGSYSGAVDNSR